jgi:integrase
MQTEPTEDGYRVWLSEDEQDQISNYYQDDMERQLSIRLGLLGLRASEIVNVSKSDIRRLQTDDEAYKLRIEESKTGYRETPLPTETKQAIQMLSNAKSLRKEEPVINSSKRSVQCWVSSAADELADETGGEDWQHVSAHDLRRTWATYTYWQIGESDRAKDVIMRWDGWSDEQTFSRNYLGREPDDLAADLMQQAGLH